MAAFGQAGFGTGGGNGGIGDRAVVAALKPDILGVGLMLTRLIVEIAIAGGTVPVGYIAVLCAGGLLSGVIFQHMIVAHGSAAVVTIPVAVGISMSRHGNNLGFGMVGIILAGVGFLALCRTGGIGGDRALVPLVSQCRNGLGLPDGLLVQIIIARISAAAGVIVKPIMRRSAAFGTGGGGRLQHQRVQRHGVGNGVSAVFHLAPFLFRPVIIQVGQGRASVKIGVGNKRLHRTGNIQIIQCAAVVKGVGSQKGQRVGQLHLARCRQIFKEIRRKLGDALLHHDRRNVASQVGPGCHTAA